MGEWLNKLKRVCLFALCILFIANQTIFALEFDTSLDDDVRKNYNPDKIEEDMKLPPLPKIKDENFENTKTPVTKSEPVNPVKPTVYNSNANINSSSCEQFATLKKGTKIETKLLSAVSDKTKKGTKVSFASLYPVSTTYYTIPSGTIFKGKIAESHRPGFSGNGGLIVIQIDSVELNGNTLAINAGITKAKSKKIFFNTIKGKRKYLTSMAKSTKPSRHFFRKMMRVSAYLASDGSSIIVAPFSLLTGCAAFAGNVIASPVLALFYKGDSISFSEGTRFELKLNQDLNIYN